MPPGVVAESASPVRILDADGFAAGPLPPGFDRPGYRAAGSAADLGRGGAVAVDWPDGRCCFYREFRHGDLLGSLLGARYLSAGPLEREIDDSRQLRACGVDVARPVVGRVEGRLFHRLALVTQRVEGRPLSVLLRENASRPAILRRVGEACARMHAAGFRHRDLHPGNLIVRPDGSVVVLDLAGGRWGGGKGDAPAWRSLVRMARYVEKHEGAPPPTRVILALLQGYLPDRAARHAAFRRLAALYRGEVRRHRFLWILGGR